ncbi:MAG: DUF4292 domain-containing protein [Bacteroidia bacterium]|nr:DUF4292 domain-containing protein [Bacteroidia bacterium]
MKCGRIILWPVLLCVILSLIPACRHRKETVTAPPLDSLGKCRLDYKSAKTLTALLQQNQLHYTYFSGKFDAELLVDGKKQEFTVVLRMKKDSVIWMSIIDPVLGAVEAARLLLTQDSIKMMDRIHKTAFVGTYDTLCSLLHTDIDFEILQSIITGNHVAFYEEEEKLRPGIDRVLCQYMLGTVRKKKFRKAMTGQKELKEPAQNIWMKDGTFKVVRLFFTDIETQRTFDANYENFQQVDSVAFPYKMTFFIKAQKNLEIRFAYKRAGLNKETTFPFLIPSGYEVHRKKP